MKAFLITIAMVIFPIIAFSETPEGIWEIEIASEGKDQFPWWREIKYPTKLVVVKNGPFYDFQFTDQFDNTCSGTAMSANKEREIVFEYCSGLGTKHDVAWGPIHHAKMVNGQLHGAVTTNQHLFNWVGRRAK